MKIKVGDIVYSDYLFFNDKESKKISGLFVVVYAEEQDSSVIHNGNVTLAKVTSANTAKDPYTVRVFPNPMNNLRKPSYVRCSKLQNVPVEYIHSVLGELSQVEWTHTLQALGRFNAEMFAQGLTIIK